MKKFSKYFMAAVMTMAMVGFVACKKDEDKKTDEPQQEYAPSTTFDILYNGHAILEGAILEYPLSAEELANDDCDVEFFVKNKSIAISREQVLTKVWDENYFGSDRVVDDTLRRLRKKLPNINIKTIYGFGYRLD